MNNEINVLTLCTGDKTSEPMTREPSHDICQTRQLTRRVVFSICKGAGTPEDAKLIFLCTFLNNVLIKKKISTILKMKKITK